MTNVLEAIGTRNPFGCKGPNQFSKLEVMESLLVSSIRLADTVKVSFCPQFGKEVISANRSGCGEGFSGDFYGTLEISRFGKGGSQGVERRGVAFSGLCDYFASELESGWAITDRIVGSGREEKGEVVLDICGIRLGL